MLLRNRSTVPGSSHFAYTILLVYLAILPSIAQSQYNPFYVPRVSLDRDSLKNILQSTQDPIRRLIALRELGHTYYENKRDSGLYYFEQSIATARSIGSKLWEADASNSIGFVSYVQGNYPRALQFLTQAMHLAENPDIEKNEWKQRVTGFVSPHVARLSILARSYQHLATLYSYTSDFASDADQQLPLYRKALAISSSIRDTAMMGIINMNISRYFSLAHQLDSVLYYQRFARELMNIAGYRRYIGTLMYIQGNTYRYAQQPDAAKVSYWFGILKGTAADNTRSVADNALALANLYLDQGNSDSALYYGYYAADHYRSTMILPGLADSYALLSSAFNKQNKIDSAFHYQGLSLSTRKELDAEDKSRRFQQLAFDEQLKAQEAEEADRVARNKMMMAILLAGLAVLIAILSFQYRNNLVRKKANKLLADKNHELEIEAALEKVRTRSLAMHKSDELQEVTNTVFEQMRALKIEAQTITIFITIEGSKDYNCWLQNDEQNYINGIHFPYFNGNKVSEDHQMGAGDIETKTYSKDLKDEWFRIMFEKSDMRKLPDNRRKFVLDAEYFTASVAEMNYTKIGLYRYSDKSFTLSEFRILKRFSQVFEQAYIRFLDLHKAESQAREAEIELALERVRARTMAMHNSEELKEVIYVVYEQFVHLNMNVEHAGFIIDYKRRDDMHIWLADPNRVPSEVNFPYFDCQHWNSFIEAKKTGKDFFSNLLGFEEKNKFYNDLFSFFNLPEEAREFYLACPGLAISTVLLDNVGLYIENFAGTPYSDEENAILMRIGKVFQQTYTRFLDLQKAEAQTMEAQIEAALERVRSRSLAMHHTDELQDVVNVAAQQLLRMNIDIDGGLFIAINDEVQQDFPFWAAAGAADYVEKVVIPFFDHPTYTGLVGAIQHREPFYTEFYAKEDKDEFMRHMFQFPPWSQNSEERKKDLLARSGGYTRSLVVNRYTCIGITNHHGKIFSDADNNVLKRFGAVLEQSYTRFLDLQKAEAQAREAQIEAALERVRSRTMAMQKSTELNEVAFVLFEQIRLLGGHLWGTGFVLCNAPEGSDEFWFANEMGVMPPVTIPNTEDEVHRAMLQGWKENQEYLLSEKGGEALAAHYAYLLTLPQMNAFFTPMLAAGFQFPTWQQWHAAYFSKGYLLFITTDPYASNDIFKRFAKVFDQTYTRFLDLQKAEEQAREAQIQLALERVRAKTMAMQSSSELADASFLMANQIRELGIKAWGCAFHIYADNEEGDYEWFSNEDGYLPFYKTPRENLFLRYYEKRKAGDTLYIEEFKGEACKHHYDYLLTLPVVGQALADLVNAGIPLPLSQIDHVAYFTYGYLLFITYEPVPEAYDIFKRFAREFEQTYTRFLDLQRAEIQAREAQIEAALEKVRSRTLSMQKSDELAETAAVMFRQLITLGIEPNRLYIIIFKEETGEMEAWLTDEDGSRVNVGLTGNYNHNQSFYKMYEGWKNGQKSLVIDMQGEELQNYFQYLNSINVPFKGGLEQKRRIQHLAYFSKGMIGMASPEPQPVDTIQLLERFAAVFNLTFTRFNDLKVAEAHALQAEQDLIAIKEAKQKAEAALTELQATQKQLIQAEKMASLGELTAGIAHEIQNPLNFVNNFAEVNTELNTELQEAIKSGDWKDAEEISLLLLENEQKILEHGKRADAIVKGMLQHTRSGTGTKEPTDINSLCEEYLRLAYHGLRAKDKSFNANFKTEFDKNIGKVNIVPQEIGRVILNLINNAFYAVNEKKKQVGESYDPEVGVSTRIVPDSNFLMISVRDNGTGIPQKVVDKIFQPFFTTKPTGVGTGLGLSLSYDTVKAHGGEIGVDSREGEGTEFIIQIPL